VASRLLPIYLNDHFAGSILGVEVARRCLKSNEGSELGVFLQELLAEIEADRATLLELMSELSVSISKAKAAAAWTGEKLGRLKLNGQLRGYSPLSRLVELEGIAAGIEGKRSLWIALAQIQDSDPRLGRLDLARLEERARSQRERLEPHRLAAACKALV
jgi:hypothetical protein